MPASFVAAGTPASGTGAVSPGLPAGIADGDLLLLIIEGEGEDGSADLGPTGWTSLGSTASGTDSAVSRTRVSVEYTFYDSASPPSTSVPDAGNHTLAIILAFRGAGTSYSTFPTFSEDSSADTALWINGGTTYNDDELVIWIATSGDNITHGAPSFPAGFTDTGEACDVNTSAGSDGAIGVWYGIKPTPGSFAQFENTMSLSVEQAYCLLQWKSAEIRDVLSRNGVARESIAEINELSAASIDQVNGVNF